METPNSGVHLLYGLLLWVLCAKWLMLFPVLFGSILPDCDHPRAMAGKWIPLWRLGVKHRGITHTAWSVCGVFAATWYLGGMTFALSLAGGYLLHLILDSTTPMGVAWLGKRKKPHRHW